METDAKHFVRNKLEIPTNQNNNFEFSQKWFDSKNTFPFLT